MLVMHLNPDSFKPNLGPAPRLSRLGRAGSRALLLSVTGATIASCVHQAPDKILFGIDCQNGPLTSEGSHRLPWKSDVQVGNYHKVRIGDRGENIECIATGFGDVPNDGPCGSTWHQITQGEAISMTNLRPNMLITITVGPPQLTSRSSPLLFQASCK